MGKGKTIVFIIGFAVVAIIGFIIIPPFIKNMSNKMYKSSAKKNKIDFDDLGPEIVRKNNKEEN